MLVQLKSTTLVVVATYDQLLEQRLRVAGRKFVVVAHILRCAKREKNDEADGTIVVFRDGAEPKICLADNVDLAPDELVIYRPLGSPLLHDLFDPLLGIDTVVITETDHATFLGMLENQKTGIPTCLSRPMQMRRLFFLGYSLDAWHYRLIMRLIQMVGSTRQPIAVRTPSCRMEELAWTRLQTDVVSMDPNAFAHRIMLELQPV